MYNWDEVDTHTKIDNADYVHPGNSWASDDGYFSFAMAFKFPFYGFYGNTMHIGTNGYISFGPEGNDAGHYPYGNSLPIPAPGGSIGGVELDGFIGLLWADLDPSSSGDGIYYGGDTNSATVTYNAIPYCCGAETPANTFQAIFYPSGAFVLQYKELQAGGSQNPSIGFENHDGSNGMQIAYGWDQAPADGTAMLILPDGQVDTYTYIRQEQPAGPLVLVGEVTQTGSSDAGTTYALSVSPDSDASGFATFDLHTIFGTPESPLLLPPAFQAVGGVDVGGISPELFAVDATLEFDSWLTLGATDGSQELGVVGFDFTTWTADSGLSCDNCAVTHVTTDGDTSGSVQVGQMTVPAVCPAGWLTATMNFQGHSQDRSGRATSFHDMIPDWTAVGVTFTIC